MTPHKFGILVIFVLSGLLVYQYVVSPIFEHKRLQKQRAQWEAEEPAFMANASENARQVGVPFGEKAAQVAKLKGAPIPAIYELDLLADQAWRECPRFHEKDSRLLDLEQAYHAGFTKGFADGYKQFYRQFDPAF